MEHGLYCGPTDVPRVCQEERLLVESFDLTKKYSPDEEPDQRGLAVKDRLEPRRPGKRTVGQIILLCPAAQVYTVKVLMCVSPVLDTE